MTIGLDSTIFLSGELGVRRITKYEPGNDTGAEGVRALVQVRVK